MDELKIVLDTTLDLSEAKRQFKKFKTSIDGAASGAKDGIKLKVAFDTNGLDKSLADIQKNINRLTEAKPIELGITINQAELKSMESQLNDLKKTLGSFSSVKLENFSGSKVSTKEISAATAEKLKQTMAIKEAEAAEKMRAATEQNNAKIDIQNSKLRIQIKKEEAIAIRSLQKEQAKKSNDANVVERVAEQVKVLNSRIERAKVTWSKMLGDPEIMARVNTLQEKLQDVGGDPAKIASLNKEWQVLTNNIAKSSLNMKSFGDRISETFSRLSAYLVNVAIIGTLAAGIKTAVGDLKDIDDQLTQLSKVTEIVKEDFQELTQQALESGSKWGRTGSDYLEAVEAFAKAGKTNYEQLADVSILAQAAGDITAQLANEYLITSDAAFKFGGNAEKLTEMLDSQNQVSKIALLCGNM